MHSEGSVEVDSLSIHYLEAGSGLAVLLLHGAAPGSSAEVWEDFLAPLAEGGYRAVAYDQPGYGLSDNPEDYTTSYRTALITKLMDALGIDQATLVGHSQAGRMAVEVALDQPSRVSGVAVVGTGPLLPPLSEPEAERERERDVEAIPSDPTLEDVRRLLESEVYNKALITPQVVERRHRLSIGKNVLAAAERSKRREPRERGKPPWQELVDLSLPLLMLYGDHDRGSAGKRALLLKEQQPGIDVRIVKDAAHLLMWDAPDVFLSALLEFLAAVRHQAIRALP